MRQSPLDRELAEENAKKACNQSATREPGTR